MLEKPVQKMAMRPSEVGNRPNVRFLLCEGNSRGIEAAQVILQDLFHTALVPESTPTGWDVPQLEHPADSERLVVQAP